MPTSKIRIRSSPCWWIASTFPPDRYFRRSIAYWGGFFGGAGNSFTRWVLLPGFDEQQVPCFVLPVEPDAESPGVELVDLVDPERQLLAQFRRHCLDVDPAHALFGCHIGCTKLHMACALKNKTTGVAG